MGSQHEKTPWDEALSTGLLWVMKTAYFLICLYLVQELLRNAPATIFPNGTGWHDLSNMEILFLTSFVLLGLRFDRKARKYSAGFFASIYRLITAVGTLSLVFLPFFLLVEIPEFNLIAEYLFIAYELTLLLLLFAIAPNKPASHGVSDSTTKPDGNPMHATSKVS